MSSVQYPAHFALSRTDTVGKVVDKYSPLVFSRIPIYEKSLDQIVGFVHRYDLVNKQAEDKFNVEMQSLMEPVHTVSDKEYVSDMIFSKQQDFPPLVKVINRKGETSEEEVEARNHFVSMLEFFSSSSFSERISDFERKKIERLASFLEKIKGDILNFS